MTPTKGQRLDLPGFQLLLWFGIRSPGTCDSPGTSVNACLWCEMFPTLSMGGWGMERRMHVSSSVQKMNVFALCLLIFENGWYVKHMGYPRRVWALILSFWIVSCANGGVWSWRNASPLGHEDEGWHHACHTWGHILPTLSYCLAQRFPNSSSLQSLKGPVETSLPSGLYPMKFHTKDMPCLCLCTICISLSTRKWVFFHSPKNQYYCGVTFFGNVWS